MEKKSARTKKLSKPTEKPKQKNLVEKTEDQIAYLAGPIEHVSDALISTDSKFNVLSWNAAAEAIYGWKAKEVIGHPLKEFLKTDYVGSTDEQIAIKQVLEHGYWKGEVMQSRKDGSHFPVMSSVSTTKDNNGQVIGLVAINRDITESKQAQEALSEFRKVMDESNDAIFMMDPDTSRYIDFNKTACERLGYNREELSQLSAIDVAEHIPSMKIWKERVELVRKSGGQLTESNYRRKDGTLFPVESSVRMMGHPKEIVVAIVRDITERKQAEQELHDSEERFRELADNIEEVFWITEPESKKEVYISPAYKKVWGRSIKDVDDFVESVLPGDRPLVEAALEKQKHGEKTEIEYRIRHEDGSVRWVWDRAFPVFDETGKLVRVAGIAADVTERKRIEQALREREERLRTIFTILPVGISIVDNHRIILESNPALGKILNLSTEELLNGKYAMFQKYLNKDNTPMSVEELPSARAIQEQKEVIDVEIGVIYKDNPTIWTQVSAAPLPEIGAVVITADINERKRAEKTILQYASELERRVEQRTAALTRANRAKDEFLANMSHELRIPLNSILGFSETLLDGVRGPLTERQSLAVETITSSGQHLLGLINDILDVAKIEAGKLDFHPQIIDATEICQNSLVFVNEMAAKKSVILEFEPLSPPAIFLGDPQRMKQILVNLLSNSIKFTPENGKVTLDVRTHAGQNQIHFRVADTGIGIAPEDLERLFDPFVQVDGSLTRQHDGSGLGLALAYKLVERHGGNISVESEVGKGSSFTVALPWNQKTDAKPEKNLASKDMLNDNQQEKNIETAPSSELPAGKRGTILLAEDIETNVMVIKDYLEYRGYQVIIAHNGAEALSQAEEFSPDAILMDIQMPEMDGLEAIRRLRANPRFASTPVIAITAFAMPGDRERCIEAGANEYLSKPISLKVLKQMIEKFM